MNQNILGHFRLYLLSRGYQRVLVRLDGNREHKQLQQKWGRKPLGSMVKVCKTVSNLPDFLPFSSVLKVY